MAWKDTFDIDEPAGPEAVADYNQDDYGKTPMPIVREGDSVIAVMGVTGVGKSTFISYFSETAVVGNDLESCTASISIHPARVGGRDVFLVDTPGFDDTNRSDTEILREVADWLNLSFQAKVKLAGIIYLHRINDNRVGGSGVRNLRMFKKLCGEEGFSCVILATTMWGNVPKEKAEEREQQLIEGSNFWADLIKRGSRTFRQDSGAESATRIVEHILAKRQQMTLRIQIEMASGAKLSDTAAGRQVGGDIAKLGERHKKEMQKLRDEMSEAIRDRDVEAQREIAQVRAEMAARMQSAEQDKKKLEVGMEELRQQRHEEAARLREEAHRRELELQQAMNDNQRAMAERMDEFRQQASQKHDEEMAAQRVLLANKDREYAQERARVHEREMANQKATLERQNRLDLQLEKNRNQERLLQSRLRRQELESENERLRNESNKGCSVM